MVAAFGGAAQAQSPAASAPAGVEHARAVERCEASVVETLRQLRGQLSDIQFSAAQRTPMPGDDSELAVRGSGRYRSDGSHAFSYSCTYNVKSGLAAGVVLREAAGETARARESWQPNLAFVSPEACESAVARLLKDRHPRVDHIVMDPGTRRIDPGADSRIAVLLSGHGALRRAPGMSTEPLRYECEIDTRNGRLLGVKTSG